MVSVKNPFINFFRKLKGGQLTIDELSLFLITIAFITAIFMIFLNLNRFILFTWFPLLVAYWRSFSKNKAKRARENQRFTNAYEPVVSFFKNTYRRIGSKKAYLYFNCKKCTQQLRIPKKTGHIKVTCPKCSHSFIKQTLRGHINRLKKGQ